MRVKEAFSVVCNESKTFLKLLVLYVMGVEEFKNLWWSVERSEGTVRKNKKLKTV